jgi:hypothetical protein
LAETGPSRPAISATRPLIFVPALEENAPQNAAGATAKNEQARRILSQINATEGAYYSTITMMNDGVNTTYNALQVSARHRLSHGYTVLYNYTYSHCLQDTETISNKLQGNTQTNPTNMRFDYGPCDYDLRHEHEYIVCLSGLQLPESGPEPDCRGMVAFLPGSIQRRLPIYASVGH